jgi:hypothetical protein
VTKFNSSEYFPNGYSKNRHGYVTFEQCVRCSEMTAKPVETNEYYVTIDGEPFADSGRVHDGEPIPFKVEYQTNKPELVFLDLQCAFKSGIKVEVKAMVDGKWKMAQVTSETSALPTHAKWPSATLMANGHWTPSVAQPTA